MVTTPIRPIPTDYPPVGSLSIITSLNKAGYTNTEFYNIDLLRPSYEEVLKHIEKVKPDVFGISAVVSTAYEYSKKLSLDVKRLCPDTTIILGGNLGASVEILLRKTGVEYICTGEGEKAMVDFVDVLLESKEKKKFRNTKGLAFLDDNDVLVFTGYSDAISRDEVYEIDQSILEDLNQMESFCIPVEDNELTAFTFAKDKRYHMPHRENKKFTTLIASKGCVARCTFCHRWDKGIRYIPVPILMKRLDYFMEKHDVGFVSFGDENFGTDKKWLKEFCEEITKRDILFRVGGMRVNTITEEWMLKLMDAGCISIYFGMETGSPRMLEIMEKMTTIEQNRTAMEIMARNDIDTIMQFIVGMPGECFETIKETAEFGAYAVQLSPKIDPNHVSVNFAQALPGTPLYEFGRRKGLIGKSFEDEEEYLIAISDRDAADGETTLNFTECPRLELEHWHFYILNTMRNAYIKKWGIDSYRDLVINSFNAARLFSSMREKETTESGYFAKPFRDIEQDGNLNAANEKKEIKLASSHAAGSNELEKFDISGKYPSMFSLLKEKRFGHVAFFYPRLFWYFRFFTTFMVIGNCVKKYGVSKTVGLTKEYIIWKIVTPFVKKIKLINEWVSLRKYNKKNTQEDIPSDSDVMKTIRLGR